jgi:catechol 2,3-dioxygenase-like lactoylglutathione lyase family enzyme
MQQQISVVTLGIADLARSRRFYVEGFGWKPVFENPEIVFYQMNGLMLGTWLAAALQADQRRELVSGAGRFSLAHNVATRDGVQPVLDRLVQLAARCCVRPTRRRMAAFAATSPTPTGMLGRSPGIPLGQLVPKDM